MIVPVGQGVWLSFFNWNGVTAATWAGLANYTGFLSDPALRAAVEHTLYFIIFFSLLPIVLGLLSAALTSHASVRGAGIFRAVIFLPQVITPAVIAVVWKRIYAPDGPFNDLLSDRRALAGWPAAGSATSPGRCPRSAWPGPGRPSASAW